MSVFTLVATFAGGMNVAMDTVAGERERRSLRLSGARQCEFTRPYPNFLIFVPKGTPSFPPVLRKCWATNSRNHPQYNCSPP
jgi:hypothetical protein